MTYVGDHTSEWSEWTQPGEAQFRLLAVDPGAPRLGAGTALVAECVRRADAEGTPTVIHTTPWMPSAQRIYARFGFVRRPDRDATYEMWHDDPRLEVAPEWIGQPFLAYFRVPRN